VRGKQRKATGLNIRPEEKKVVRDGNTFYFAYGVYGVTTYPHPLHNPLSRRFDQALVSFSMLYRYRQIMQNESGIRVNIYKFIEGSPCFFAYWPFTAPFTCDRAASAFRRSPSLRDLNGPPPGVLAPDMTDDARERTFITSGLRWYVNTRPQGELSRHIQWIAILFILVSVRPLKASAIVTGAKRLHLWELSGIRSKPDIMKSTSSVNVPMSPGVAKPVILNRGLAGVLIASFSGPEAKSKSSSVSLLA
jgi:hypothetical protein